MKILITVNKQMVTILVCFLFKQENQVFICIILIQIDILFECFK